MSNILTIGFIAEGSTDVRFLEQVIGRTFRDITLDCSSQIEVYPPQYIKVSKQGIVPYILEASSQANEQGAMVLCVHSDADDANETNTWHNRLSPAFKAVNDADNNRCKILVGIVPVHMTEAWMLSDKELFKNEIATTLTDVELGIERHPEQIADPKAAIEEALRRAQAHRTKRRRSDLSIADLYAPLGQSIPLAKLEVMASYQAFKERAKAALRLLNYLN